MLNSNTEVNSIYAYSVAIKSGIGGRFMRTTLCVWPCKQRNEQELKNVSWRHRKKPFHFSVILVLKVMLHFSFLFFFLSHLYSLIFPRQWWHLLLFAERQFAARLISVLLKTDKRKTLNWWHEMLGFSEIVST